MTGRPVRRRARRSSGLLLKDHSHETSRGARWRAKKSYQRVRCWHHYRVTAADERRHSERYRVRRHLTGSEVFDHNLDLMEAFAIGRRPHERLRSPGTRIRDSNVEIPSQDEWPIAVGNVELKGERTWIRVCCGHGPYHLRAKRLWRRQGWCYGDDPYSRRDGDTCHCSKAYK